MPMANLHIFQTQPCNSNQTSLAAREFNQQSAQTPVPKCVSTSFLSCLNEVFVWLVGGMLPEAGGGVTTVVT